MSTLFRSIDLLQLYEDVSNKLPNDEITSCSFQNEFIYKFIENILHYSPSNIMNNVGGFNKINKKNKKNKTKKNVKNKKTKKNYKYKQQKEQKGGFNYKIFIFFIMHFINFIIFPVNSVKEVTDEEILDNLEKVFKYPYLLANDEYGTCSINSMFFLRSIDLNQFKDLSIEKIKGRISFDKKQITKYITKDQHYSWEFQWREINELYSMQINNYTDFSHLLHNNLVYLKNEYGIKDNSGLITMFTFSGKDYGHAVVLWLNSNNELFLIDVQDIYDSEKIIVYKNIETKMKLLYGDIIIYIKPIWEYFETMKLDLKSEHFIYKNIHKITDNKFLDYDKKRIVETIKNIENEKKNKQFFYNSKIPNLRGFDRHNEL